MSNDRYRGNGGQRSLPVRVPPPDLTGGPIESQIVKPSGYGIEVTGFGAGTRSGARRKRAGGDALANRDRSGNYVPPESETAFQKWVIDTAHWYDWLVFHPLPAGIREEPDVDERDGLIVVGSRRRKYVTALQGDAGFTDLVLAKPGRLPILAELKTDKGRVSPKQKRWAEAIHPDCYRLWRPKDRPEILAELSGDSGGVVRVH